MPTQRRWECRQGDSGGDRTLAATGAGGTLAPRERPTRITDCCTDCTDGRVAQTGALHRRAPYTDQRPAPMGSPREPALAALCRHPRRNRRPGSRNRCTICCVLLSRHQRRRITWGSTSLRRNQPFAPPPALRGGMIECPRRYRPARRRDAVAWRPVLLKPRAVVGARRSGSPCDRFAPGVRGTLSCGSSATTVSTPRRHRGP